ncbi:hypothetical protein MD484_g7726, partial [Candolleomyces efflorescens]
MSCDTVPSALAEIGRLGDPRFKWPRHPYSLVVEPADYAQLDILSRQFTLIEEELAFLSLMAYFVDQAMREDCEEEFLGHIYGHVFSEWPQEEPIPRNYHHVQAQRKEYLRLWLVKLHWDVLGNEPPCNWETFLALPPCEYEVVSKHLLQMEHNPGQGETVSQKSGDGNRAVADEVVESESEYERGSSGHSNVALFSDLLNRSRYSSPI